MCKKESGKETKQAQQQDIPLNLDEILKVLFRLSDKLTVRMINSLFGKSIPLDAKVTTENVELHRFSQTGPEMEELRADMIVSVNGERYHIEFQVLNEKMMPARMFEYGFVIAIQEIKSYIKDIKDGIQLNYPKQYVIFIEQNDAIPKHEISMRVRLWDGDEKEYKVPVMRYWLETPESLEAKELEPLLPLQVFKLRKILSDIARSRKPESEKEALTEAKLRELIQIYEKLTDKIREWTEQDGLLTAYQAEQMFLALQHLSEYLYNEYKGYTNIEREALKMSESRWAFSKWLRQGEEIGVEKQGRETAYEMFLDGENIIKIKKYSKLPDEKLAEVLADLPAEIQSKYSILTNYVKR